MKKISFSASNSILFKYIIKALSVSIICVALLSLIVSEILYKLDLPTDGAGVITFIICVLTAFVTAFFSTFGFKNNGAVLGALSELPLIILIIVNMTFNKTDIILSLIKIAIVLIIGAVTGAFRVRKNNRFKV